MTMAVQWTVAGAIGQGGQNAAQAVAEVSRNAHDTAIVPCQHMVVKTVWVTQRNTRTATHKDVQLMVTGVLGLTGHHVPRPVVEALEPGQGAVMTHHPLMVARTAKDQKVKLTVVDLTLVQMNPQMDHLWTVAGLSGLIGASAQLHVEEVSRLAQEHALIQNLPMEAKSVMVLSRSPKHVPRMAVLLMEGGVSGEIGLSVQSLAAVDTRHVTVTVTTQNQPMVGRHV